MESVEFGCQGGYGGTHMVVGKRVLRPRTTLASHAVAGTCSHWSAPPYPKCICRLNPILHTSCSLLFSSIGILTVNDYPIGQRAGTERVSVQGRGKKKQRERQYKRHPCRRGQQLVAHPRNNLQLTPTDVKLRYRIGVDVSSQCQSAIWLATELPKIKFLLMQTILTWQ